MNDIIKIILIVFGIALTLIFLTLIGRLIKNQNIMVETLSNFNEDFYTNLEIIESNCGSTYITPCSFNSKDLCIFTKICNEEDYCKFYYIPLEECLKCQNCLKY